MIPEVKNRLNNLLSIGNGFLIAIEGGDGAGKTTFAHTLQKDLEESGYKTLYVRNPGSDEVTDKIRDITKHHRLNWFSSACLFGAALKHSIETQIMPALKENRIVLIDRFIRSTYIYQMFYTKFPGESKADYENRRSFFKSLTTMTIKGILSQHPFIEVVLTVSPEVAWKRVHDRDTSDSDDVYEAEKDYFMGIHKAYQNSLDYETHCVFLAMMANYVLNGNLSPESILADFYQQISEVDTHACYKSIR